jgi:glutathione peroxidase
MKMKLLILACCLSVGFISAKAQCPETFHDFSALDIYGDTLHMSSFIGKKVLVVNTASFCGYTHQYGSLQSLYETYGGNQNPYNFEIIGFPSNDFNQEPHPEDSIIGVCEDYGITFTMMSKVHVKAVAGQHEIYKWLTLLARNCVQNASVTWNFQKFMVNEDGSWYGVASTQTSPTHSSIVNWITGAASVEENGAHPSENVQIYFSPADRALHMEAFSEQPQHIKIQLWSLSGRLVSSLFDGTVSGNMHMQQPLVSVAPGIYFVEVSGVDWQMHRKVLIQ